MPGASDRNTEGTFVILVTGTGRLLFMVLMFAHCMYLIERLVIACTLYICLQHRLHVEIINKSAILFR